MATIGDLIGFRGKEVSLRYFFTIALAASFFFSAGAEEDTAAVEFITTPDLELEFVIPGWMANAKGTVTTSGIPVDVNVNLFDILESLDMAAIGGLAGQYGKFGFYIEGLYGELSVGGKTSGQILTSVDVGVNAILAEGYVSYRILEEDDYWLDFIAGTRYKDLEVGYSLGVSRDGVRAFSQQTSSDLADRIADIVSNEIADWLEGLLPPWAGRGPSSQVFAGTSNRILGLNAVVRDQINRDIRSSGSVLGDRIADSPAVQASISDYARVLAQGEVDIVEAVGLSAVDRDAINRQVRARLAKAEANLARVIEDTINDLVPSTKVSGSRAWVDPFFGFRGIYQLIDQWHVAGKGDVGGFSLGSELTYSLYGAVGYQCTERTTLELG